jgi:hypothetical protein
VTRSRRVALGLGAGLVALIVLSGALVLAYGEYLQTPHYRRHAVPIDGYVSSGETELQITVPAGSWDIVEEPEAREDAHRITVSAWVLEYFPGSGGFKNLARWEYKKKIVLKAPLGDRAVIDSATGRPVPKL